MQGHPAPVDQFAARQNASPGLHDLQHGTARLDDPVPACRVCAGPPHRTGEDRGTMAERHHAVRPEPAIMKPAPQIRRAMRQQVVQKRPPRP